MTFSDDILSDHMNRSPLAVFMEENGGGTKIILYFKSWIGLIFVDF